MTSADGVAQRALCDFIGGLRRRGPLRRMKLYFTAVQGGQSVPVPWPHCETLHYKTVGAATIEAIGTQPLLRRLPRAAARAHGGVRDGAPAV